MEVEVENATDGVPSLSLIVYVCVLSLPRIALFGLDKVTMTVSLVSSNKSSTIPPIVIVPDVSPALMVRVPSANV